MEKRAKPLRPRVRVYARDTRTRARGRQVFVEILAGLGSPRVQRSLIEVGWVYDAAP